MLSNSVLLLLYYTFHLLAFSIEYCICPVAMSEIESFDHTETIDITSIPRSFSDQKLEHFTPGFFYYLFSLIGMLFTTLVVAVLLIFCLSRLLQRFNRAGCRFGEWTFPTRIVDICSRCWAEEELNNRPIALSSIATQTAAVARADDATSVCSDDLMADCIDDVIVSADQRGSDVV